MNNAQGPPVHYPNSHESTAEVFRTNESSPRPSPNPSTSTSPRSEAPLHATPAPPPPALRHFSSGETLTPETPVTGVGGGAPPTSDPEEYDVVREMEQEKLAPRTKTLIVRVLSAIFIVTILAIIIAAVATKIQDMHKNYGIEVDSQG